MNDLHVRIKLFCLNLVIKLLVAIILWPYFSGAREGRPQGKPATMLGGGNTAVASRVRSQGNRRREQRYQRTKQDHSQQQQALEVGELCDHNNNNNNNQSK